MGYYEYLPASYHRTGKASPLIIATNGFGENGTGSAEDLPALLRTGIPRFIHVGGWPTSRPFVVLAPQHHEQQPGFSNPACDAGPWSGSCFLTMQHTLGHPPESPCTTPDELHAFIDYAIHRYNVDKIYLTGLSCGAFGIWEYLGKYSNTQGVRAAVPVSGEGRPSLATYGCALARVPIWAFHGKDDDLVNPAGSTAPIQTIRATCRGTSASTHKVQLTNYGHYGWDAVWSGELGFDVFRWMLSR
jgi:predicted peptidase